LCLSAVFETLKQGGVSMQLGYARVSTPDQSMDLQKKDALEAAGVKEIFEDVGSGVRAKRTGLERLLVYARPGDTVVVWRLDRLGRSLRDLVGLISDLQARGVAFRSLQENIDTTTASGKLFLHVFAALAEFERELVRERTIAGLKAAADRGRKGGRPRLMDETKIQFARALHKEKAIAVKEICRMLGISKGTLYRSLEGKPKVDTI
jgi:DNA invertase Pin-like site-specific DNA recombinase